MPLRTLYTDGCVTDGLRDIHILRLFKQRGTN